MKYFLLLCSFTVSPNGSCMQRISPGDTTFQRDHVGFWKSFNETIRNGNVWTPGTMLFNSIIALSVQLHATNSTSYSSIII